MSLSIRSIITMSRMLLGAVLLGNLRASASNAGGPVMMAPPTQVRFQSIDYKNVLHWTPTSNSSDLQYHVQWKIYGQREWRDVDGCQGIHRHHCDLSHMTSEPREWYYARVHAASLPSSQSAWALSPRFSPRRESKISPPKLKLNATEQGITVHVMPPRSSVHKIHRCLFYEIYLLHGNETEDAFEMDCSTNKLILDKLSNRTEYCLQARYIVPMQTKSSERSVQQCITTL